MEIKETDKDMRLKRAANLAASKLTTGRGLKTAQPREEVENEETKAGKEEIARSPTDSEKTKKDKRKKKEKKRRRRRKKKKKKRR